MISKIADKIIGNEKTGKWIEGISAIIVLAAVCCSIRMNIVGRTLWLDEAMLAISFRTRTFAELLQAPLAWNQSAPVGYLIAVKLLTLIFGTSEWAFRLFSILAYIGVLAVFYVLCRRTIGLRYPMLATAALANIAYLLEYSNMFKPYICDALCVLLVLLVYWAFREGKCKTLPAALLFALLIWCSNPVAFVSGGVAAYEVLYGLIHKEKKHIADGMIIGGAIVVSFVIMYLVWLAPTLASTNLSEFWEGYQFPLNLTNKANILEAAASIKFVTENLGGLWKGVLVLAILTVVINILAKRNAYVWVLTFAIAITLVASNRGFFPMSDRLFLFCLPLLCYLALFAVKWLAEWLAKEKYQQLVIVLVIGTFLVSGTGILKYHSGQAYREGEEANPSLDYLEEHVEAGDDVYVYYPAIPVFMYHFGYDTDSICGYEDNVIMGQKEAYEEGDYENDLATLIEEDSVYLLFTHMAGYEWPDPMMQALSESGNLEKINDNYLFHYSADRDRAMGRFQYKLVSKETVDGKCTATVEITNCGETYLNNGWETWYFGDGSEAVQDMVEIADIAPGETITVTYTFDTAGSGKKMLQLYEAGGKTGELYKAKPLAVQAD